MGYVSTSCSSLNVLVLIFYGLILSMATELWPFAELRSESSQFPLLISHVPLSPFSI